MIFYSIFANVMLQLAQCDTRIFQTVSTSRHSLKYGKLTNSWNERYKIVPSGIQHWSLALQIEHREHWRWMMIFPFNLLYPWSPDWKKKRGSPTLLAEVNWWLTGRNSRLTSSDSRDSKFLFLMSHFLLFQFLRHAWCIHEWK